MSTGLIELRDGTGECRDDLPGLRVKLVELLGAPFQFARVSYGDELTLHFGDVRPARSRKLKNLSYGTYVLGVRGSSWVLKSGLEPVVLGCGVVPIVGGRPSVVRPLSNVELESGKYIEASSRVLRAEPFSVRPVEGIGLQITMSDGSEIVVLPSGEEPDEDEGLPELADWDLLSPHGFIQAGPGPRWCFEPHSRSRPA
jgi:hypothetical protein